jgi:hypothetical protein
MIAAQSVATPGLAQFLPRLALPWSSERSASYLPYWECSLPLAGPRSRIALLPPITSRSFLVGSGASGTNQHLFRFLTRSWIVILVAAALVILTGIDPVSLVEYSIVFAVIILPMTYGRSCRLRATKHPCANS